MSDGRRRNAAAQTITQTAIGVTVRIKTHLTVYYYDRTFFRVILSGCSTKNVDLTPQGMLTLDLYSNGPPLCTKTTFNAFVRDSTALLRAGGLHIHTRKLQLGFSTNFVVHRFKAKKFVITSFFNYDS